jgi:hypothetical protein
MSVRRRSSRLQVLNADGVLRVWRDVSGFRTDTGEYLVISNEAAVKGEQLTIYLASGTDRPIPVRVIDSQPLIFDGSVRHQLRLSPLGEKTFGPLETTRNGEPEAE